MHQSANGFATDDFLQISIYIHIKDINGQMILSAHGGCR